MTKPVHSPIGASSMSRWSKCPGSIRLSRDLPKTTSSYAEEGTLAHDVAARALMLPIVDCISGVDPEMEKHVLSYCNFVTDELGMGRLYVEKSFDLSEDLYPGLYGTSDAVIWDKETRVLKVIDFKYGAGVAVEVTDNLQLMYYALGAMMTLNLPAEIVEIIIHQPRAFHPDGPVRRQKMTALAIRDFAEELVEAAKRTEDPNAPLIPGDQCRFCPASGVCPKLHEKALALAQDDFGAVETYDRDKLSKALSWAPILKQWLDSVEKFAYARACAGDEIPGFKLVEKRSTRKWVDESAVVAFAKASGLVEEEIFSKSVKSPAQLEKLLTKDGKKSLERLVVKSSSGLTLVEESDKRPKALADASVEFTVIGEEN